jgi:tryptophan synthase alpha chain
VSRIAERLAERRASGRLALVPYITAGYPDVETTVDLAVALADAGADLLELGVPFSDPLADGVTIQRASFAALEAGVTLRTCLEVATRIRARRPIPLLFMGYYNPFLRYGLDAFAEDSARAGLDGLIVPDLPPEEAGELQSALATRGLDLIYLLAPTSTDERIGLVARGATGFVYCASLAGVTGARSKLSAELPAFLERVRRQTDLPICVGFGISRPEHVAALVGMADGAIVGSALVALVERLAPEERVTGAASYIAELRNAADGVPV